MKRYRGVLWPIATLLLASLLVAKLAPFGEPASEPGAPAAAVEPPQIDDGHAPGDRLAAQSPAVGGDEPTRPAPGCPPAPGVQQAAGLDVMIGEQRAAHYRNLVSVLRASPDPEHLLAAAIAARADGSGAEEASRLMGAALNARRDHPLVTWNALHFCSTSTDAEFCSGSALEQRAARVDGDNGALWARIAAYRRARGDVAGALDAALRVSTSPGFDLYLFEHLRLIGRALAAAGSGAADTRIADAIGIVAAMPGDEFLLGGACVELAPQSHEWRHACLRAGERFERASRTVMGIAVGLGMQRTVLELGGDDRALQAVIARSERLRNRMSASAAADLLGLLYRHPGLQADYLDIGEAHGELAALDFATAEAERRGAADADCPR